jgi:5'(3')-deoxyribonucleotidase
MHLFCDMDGVLADFDRGYEIVLGRPIAKRDYHKDWTQEDWDLLHRTSPTFFRDLPPMPDAEELWSYIKRYNPRILTGVPKEVGVSGNQKIEWASRQPFIGPSTEVVCCRSREKYLHCRPGDVIIDDWPKYQNHWQAAGGIWVTHTSASATIARLKELGL